MKKKLSKSSMAIEQESSLFKPWFLAARPRTLPICLAPILVGTLLAKGAVVNINWPLAILAFLSVLFIQVGTNLVNDALDFKKGADTQERLGPTRMTQAGLLSFQQVLKGGLFCFSFALLLGIPLVIAGGWPFALILLFSVACGYLYTGGPRPLAYHGLGEPFIFIFYGLVASPAVFYLQTGFVDASCLIAGVQMGLLAMIPNAINNLRDIVSDAKVNKLTLAVRFGIAFARWEITVFSLAPFFVGLAWLLKGHLFLTLLPIAAFPLAVRLVNTIWSTPQGSSYAESFGQSVLLLFLFAFALGMGCLL